MKTENQTISSVTISKQEQALAGDSIPKLFIKFVVPAVAALLFFSIQVFIDGIIISNYVGVNAMSSVNIVIPLFSILTALTLTISIGCQVIIGIRLGQMKHNEANDAFKSGLVLALGISFLWSIITYCFAPSLALLLGANHVLINDSVTYIRVISIFFMAPALMLVCDATLKAMGYPTKAVIGMIIMTLSNVALDVLFIIAFDWGVRGAAFGTGLSYLITITYYSSYFWNGKYVLSFGRGKAEFAIMGRILYNGSSEGFAELIGGMVALLCNITLMKYAAEKGVAAFTAINYLTWIAVIFFIGMSDGIRSIVSYNYGHKQYDRVKHAIKLGALVTLTLSLIIFGILYFRVESLISIFFDHTSSDIIQMATIGAKIMAIAFFFDGFNILISGYFTSIGNAKLSLIITTLRGGIFALGILILPTFIGLTGVWCSIPIAEGLTLIISYSLYRRYKH